MPDITIPDAAVEAAAQVYFGEYGPSINWNSPSMSEEERDTWRNEMSAYLLAAAPHIAAQALRDAADEVRGYAYTPDDVREVAHGDDYADGITDAHHVFDRLLATRAARIEADHG